ncbi:hypothetical protein EDB83DRAFT_2312908 [Lactarius deliciosus]|nr:hypothetical protein EDB83DRAFT_2312908 [Lactarius deliciosus]
MTPATDQDLTFTMSTTTDFTSIPMLNYDLLASPDIPPRRPRLHGHPAAAERAHQRRLPLPRAPSDTHRPLRRGDRVPTPLLRATAGAQGRAPQGTTSSAIPTPAWSSPTDVPGFKTTFERHLAAVENPSYEFVRLMAEVLGLALDGLARFFDARERMQHHAKLLKYPTRDEAATEQGIGPRFDAGFMTFCLLSVPHPPWLCRRSHPTATDHPGLQAQNLSGQWIEVFPRPYTFVINFGKGLESVTQGLARATSHHVLVPPAGSLPRYSIPFFQNIAQGVWLSEHASRQLSHQPRSPPKVLRLKWRRGELGQTDSVNFGEYDTLPSGQVPFISRDKLSGVAKYWADEKFQRSHPNVAEKQYPELFKQIFPCGMPRRNAD